MSGPMNIKAKNVKWQDPSKFKIAITGPGAEKAGLSSVDPSLLSMSCTGIQLADINQTPIEDYIGEQWVYSSGRLEAYQISIGFKDYDNFTLYKIWAKAIQDFLREYPADTKFNIEIYTADDFNPTSFSKVVEFKNCLLVAVGGSSLDNSAIASIAEFTVQMKCNYVETF
jgi:hypothetical protein